MAWLLIGGGVLFLVLLLAQGFVSANPKNLARIIRYSGAAILILLSIPAFLRGGPSLGLPLLGLAFLLLGWRTPFFPWSSGPWGPGTGPARRSAGQTSSIETASLAMTLDHDTGAMDGEVRTGRFQGRLLSELSIQELLALLEEFRTQDLDAARLLEAYMDRHRREEMNAAGYRGGESGAPPSGAMTEEEAWAILGLEPGADREAIIAAHRALMKKLHPDQGGSTYLAMKINQAKETLLGE